MSHAKNKVEWCLRKAEKEQLNEASTHRGLVKVKTDIEKAKHFIMKAERYLKATEHLKKVGLSDISAGTIFYSMYHCLLAIAAKHGYESRNQECTFALIYSLIEDKKIDFEEDILVRVALLEPKDDDETSLKVRERYQYGTEFSIEDDLYKKLVKLAKEVVAKTKEIIEK